MLCYGLLLLESPTAGGDEGERRQRAQATPSSDLVPLMPEHALIHLALLLPGRLPRAGLWWA